MIEEWRDIPGHKGYRASSLGRIAGPKAIFKPGNHNMGYDVVSAPQTVGVHILVCKAFHPDTYFPGAFALHKNHTKKDNVPSNLYWGTHQQNVDDSVRADLVPHGSRVATSKLDWDKVREIRRRVAAGESGRSLAKEFGVGQPTVSELVRGVTWKERA